MFGGAGGGQSPFQGGVNPNATINPNATLNVNNSIAAPLNQSIAAPLNPNATLNPNNTGLFGVQSQNALGGGLGSTASPFNRPGAAVGNLTTPALGTSPLLGASPFGAVPAQPIAASAGGGLFGGAATTPALGGSALGTNPYRHFSFI